MGDLQWIDQAARILAQGASRRDLLKTLGALAVGGGLGMIRQTQAEAQASPARAAAAKNKKATCGTQVTPLQQNVVTGTCETLAQRIAQGVFNGERNLPGWPGATRVSFQFEASGYDFSIRESDGQLCLKTLKQKGRRSLILTPKLDVRWYRLDWQPCDASPECRAEIARWESQITRHECVHVGDAQSIQKKAQKAWKKPVILEVCVPLGDDPQGARMRAEQELAARIKAMVEAEGAKLTKQAEDNATAFHGTPAGGPATRPSCTICEAARSPAGSGEQCSAKVYCACNGKCYDEVTTCLDECRVSLGCFVGICGPAAPGQC